MSDQVYEAQALEIAKMADEIRAFKAENARLQKRITTQKQTIQSYRDESREWRDVADAREQTIDRMSAKDAKLQKICVDMYLYHKDGFILPDEIVDEFARQLSELGIEVNR